MEEKRFKSKQRPSKFFSVKQKHEIIKAYLEGSKSKQQVWQEFTGDEEEKGQIIKYMRQLGYLEAKVKKKPATFYMKDKTASKPVPLPPKDEKDAEIDKLKKELQDCHIREQYYLTMIEIAENELKISIRKKSCTK